MTLKFKVGDRVKIKKGSVFRYQSFLPGTIIDIKDDAYCYVVEWDEKKGRTLVYPEDDLENGKIENWKERIK